MLNSSACQKVSILKPPTKCASIKIIQALMIKRNKPSVSKVAGKVSNTINGFINASRKDSTTATMTAVNMLLISMPGKI